MTDAYAADNNAILQKNGEEFAADEVEIGFPEELVTPYIDHADDLEGLQSEATDY